MCSSQNRFSAWFSLAVCNSCVFVQRCLPSHTSARITSALKWTPSVFGRHTHISAQALISVRPCAGLVVRSQRTLTARSEICASCEHIPSIPTNTHTHASFCRAALAAVVESVFDACESDLCWVQVWWARGSAGRLWGAVFAGHLCSRETSALYRSCVRDGTDWLYCASVLLLFILALPLRVWFNHTVELWPSLSDISWTLSQTNTLLYL